LDCYAFRGSYGPSPTNFQGNEDMGDLEPKKKRGRKGQTDNG